MSPISFKNSEMQNELFEVIFTIVKLKYKPVIYNKLIKFCDAVSGYKQTVGLHTKLEIIECKFMLLDKMNE